jgi:hypothetical protein
VENSFLPLETPVKERNNAVTAAVEVSPELDRADHGEDAKGWAEMLTSAALANSA